jgi:T5SS/PEP-CTERM-associated repeat protein
VTVTGNGSLWSNRSFLTVGVGGDTLTLGLNASSVSNRVVVNGGSLIVTNAGGMGTVDVRRGVVELDTDTALVTGDIFLGPANDSTLLFGGWRRCHRPGQQRRPCHDGRRSHSDGRFLGGAGRADALGQLDH